MSNAWEVTTEDVITALAFKNVVCENFYDEQDWDDFVDECIGILNLDEVEKVALRGNKMIEQSEGALEEIQRQLSEAGKC